ncbi:MAG: hypothetical protein QOC71_1938 [Thermoplasmata archaeon]|jgi:hypothetical protein|nr:hypothetical protein [Thermoplasmata archaeon]
MTHGVIANQRILEGVLRGKCGLPQPVVGIDAFLAPQLRADLKEPENQGARWAKRVKQAAGVRPDAETWLAYISPRTFTSRGKQKVYPGCPDLDDFKIQAAGAAGISRVFLDGNRKESLDTKVDRANRAIDQAGLVGNRLQVGIGFDLALAGDAKVFKQALDADDLRTLQVHVGTKTAARRAVRIIAEARAEGNDALILASDVKPLFDDRGASAYARLLAAGVDAVLPAMGRPRFLPPDTKVRPAKERAADNLFVYNRPRGGFFSPPRLPTGWKPPQEFGAPAEVLARIEDDQDYTDAIDATQRGVLWDHWRDLIDLQHIGVEDFLKSKPLLAPYAKT